MYWLRITAIGSMLLSIATTISPMSTGIANAQQNTAANEELRVPANGVGQLAKQLNLSSDQIHRLRRLQAESRGKNKHRRQELLTAKQELSQLLQGNASSQRIRQQRQQVQAIQREISDTNFENTLAIREILTPTQRVKLQQLLEQRRQHRGTLN